MDSLIETSVSRDILLLTRVDKPALLRRLFELGCRYSGQIPSYTKMLGQLQDVVRRNRKLTAIEVKSGHRRDCLPGMSAFVEAYQPARCLLVGGDGIPLADFQRKPATHWL